MVGNFGILLVGHLPTFCFICWDIFPEFLKTICRCSCPCLCPAISHKWKTYIPRLPLICYKVFLGGTRNSSWLFLFGNSLTCVFGKWLAHCSKMQDGYVVISHSPICFCLKHVDVQHRTIIINALLLYWLTIWRFTKFRCKGGE